MKNKKNEILDGIKANVDVLTYTKSEFDLRKMGQVRLALKEGLDISEVAKRCFEWKQAEQSYYIRNKLIKNNYNYLQKELFVIL